MAVDHGNARTPPSSHGENIKTNIWMAAWHLMDKAVISILVQALVANSQICPFAARIVLDMHYTAKLASCSISELNPFITLRY